MLKLKKNKSDTNYANMCVATREAAAGVGKGGAMAVGAANDECHGHD